MNRNRIIAGVVILTVLLTAGFSASSLWRKEWQSRQPHAGKRSPVPSLSYCAPDGVRPCVQSFQLDASSRMVIRVLTENNSPMFAIEVRSAQGQARFTCEREEPSSSEVTCTGNALPVGQAVQFAIVSTEKNTLLAQGTFPIIGIALATPKLAVSPTPVPAFERPPR